MTETPGSPELDLQLAVSQSEIDKARAAGFITPSGDDPIRDGDQAITTNAVVAYDLINSVSPYKGVLPDGTDIDTVREPGVYTVSSTATAATMLNWPTIRAGILTVGSNAGSNATTQDVLARVSSTDPTERYTRATINASGGWSPWASAEWVKGSANGSDLDTMRTAGSWAISSAKTVTGMPEEIRLMPSVLEIMTFPGTGVSMQRITARSSENEFDSFCRMALTVSGFAGVEWQRIGTGSGGNVDPAPAVDPVSDHAGRVEYARSRRGGGIGTGGKAVVMLRFDHWLMKFRDDILPILQEFSLTGTLNMNYDNLSLDQNGAGSITWEQVQDWNQYDGIEIANHGSTHTNAATRDTIYHEVVDGRRNLEAAMPRVAVETWQEHGSAYLVAGDIPGDIGLDLGREPRNFFESYAGKLVLAEHAVIEGKCGGFFQTIYGNPQIGQSHMSIDRSTAVEAIGQVETAKQFERAVTLYVHPGLMDTVLVGGRAWEVDYNSDGSIIVTDPETANTTPFSTETEFRTWAADNGHTVYMQTSHLYDLCAYLAAERDAGRIMVMTAAGGAFANRLSDHRENLLTAAEFGTGWEEWWAGWSGYTVTNPGPEVTITTGATSAPARQSILLHSRFGWAMGATHELVVRARATAAGAQLTLRAEQIGNAENWSVERVFTPDSEIREYRLNVTLPRDPTISQITVSLGGPSLEIHGAPLLAAI